MAGADFPRGFPGPRYDKTRLREYFAADNSLVYALKCWFARRNYAVAQLALYNARKDAINARILQSALRACYFK